MVAAKDEQDSEDVGKTVFTFGPRFHLEIGLPQLALSYYSLLGQPPNEGYIAGLRQVGLA